MRRRSPLVRTSSETDLNTAMTPMIDVVFLLLVFFVWTASFQIIEYVLPSELSAQTGSESVQDPVDPPPLKDVPDIVVKIRWSGETANWLVNEQPVDTLAEVKTRLQRLAEFDEEETKLILYPESVVPLGDVIETYDVATLAGFRDKIAFAVDMKQ